MKADVISAYSDGRILNKRPSKETLNHPGLIYYASGIDPYEDTPGAYLGAYESLGIDVLNRVPSSNVTKRLEPGESAPYNERYAHAYLGLYDTFFREHFPYETPEELFADDSFELDYHALITPVPHCLDTQVIGRKMEQAGDIGLYYYMLYTNLFMWGVEYLGWEVFMIAAMLDPDRFARHFLDKAFAASGSLIGTLCEIDSPYVFVHDDLADANGPVFPPAWYDEHIFSRYPELWAPVKEAGKKLIFVADGNMGPLLPRLRACGVDGVHLENPATDLDVILEVFGDKIIICGMDTKRLTFGKPEQIHEHVEHIAARTRDIPGFTICSPGGIHANVPLENLEAYFDARVEHGFTPDGWRKGDRDVAQAMCGRRPQA